MNTSLLLDDSFSLRLVQTLMHFLWQGTAIAAVVVILDLGLRKRSAQARYLLNVGGLFCMVASLLMTYIVLAPDDNSAVRAVLAPLPNEQIRTVPDPAPVAPATAHSSKVSVETVSRESSASQPETSEPGDSPVRVVLPGKDDKKPSLSDLPVVESEPSERAFLAVASPYVAYGYFLCVLGMLGRLVSGVWGGNRLRRAAVAVEDETLLPRVTKYARAMGLRIAPVIARCEQISVPVVAGIVRPMILIPCAIIGGLSAHQLEALIVHEMAHLRRKDPLINLLQRVIEAVIFFHPAVWYLSHRINVERENASDDLVLAAGWERIDYADALVRMAELSASHRRSRPVPASSTLAASGGSRSDFKRRVMRLLNAPPSNLRISERGLVASLLIGVVTVALMLSVKGWNPQFLAADENKETEVPASGEQLGRHIDNFRLQDYLGAEHELDDFAQNDLVVVAFLGAECPLAKLYGPRLVELAEKYRSHNVAFMAINSNFQDTPTDLGHYARKQGITFPLLKDPGNRVADQFHAERTPEVFVLDRKRIVRYWGRIDNQFGIGFARPVPTQNDLADAIDDLLAGRAVQTPHTASVGCHISRVKKVAPKGDITYANQISRIVQNRCVECHRDRGIAPFSLESYDDVAAWSETILEVIRMRRMPPWFANPEYGHFANDGRMPEEEKDLLKKWVANGVPQGDLSQSPPRREFVDGWALGEPDLVLKLPEPIHIPPNGVVDYQYITIDPGFTEGKWVRASEVRPGVRSVVHHIIVFINPPGGDPILEEQGFGFETAGGYVPGSPPMELEDGVARYVPAGSTFVFQMHYTPDGTERHDQSEIGLYFADPSTVNRTMQTGVIANLDFTIPAGAGDHRVEATHRFSHNTLLYSLYPHMHYRGKSFRFEATYPNGSREILLDVPRYDFNWQNVYRFEQPRFMPEGTLLKCIAHFDNSEQNLSNPDPTIPVSWGEQTWDEMMVGYFEGVFLNQDLTLPEPQVTPLGDGRYRVQFQYRPDRPVTSVHLAGTFNDWNNMSHPLTDADGDGIYTTDIVINQGEYRYKFVIDGDYWTHDPASRILTGFFHESILLAGPETNPNKGE